MENESVRLVATSEDGEARRGVCERGLEGVVAKRLRDTYRPEDARNVLSSSSLRFRGRTGESIAITFFEGDLQFEIAPPTGDSHQFSFVRTASTLQAWPCSRSV